MKSERPTILVVCGGDEAVPGIERVKALGARVLVADGNPQAPGFALADGSIVASTYDPDEILRQARAHHAVPPIAGVMSIAADVPWTVARLASELGLPGLSLETARLATDKLAMKERFREAGVPIPWFAPVDSPGELARLLAERGELVIKPVDSRGARGVMRLREGDDVQWAFETSRSHSPGARVMVEEFLEGAQLSTESTICAGRAWTLGCSDRNYELLETHAPFMIENGGCQPTVHLEDFLDAIDELIFSAASAIRLETGTLKGDLVLHPERGPVVIEVAPRLSGGWFCTDQIPLSTGVDLVQIAARLALGDEPAASELTPRSWRPVAVRYFFPEPGRVLAVHGAQALAREPWVHRLMLFARPGETLHPVTDHTRRAGLVITLGDTREQAVRRAEEAVRRVRFETAAGGVPLPGSPASGSGAA